jgi:glycine cleavage system H lipoate-binding protein
MAGKIYKTALGKTVDMGKLVLQNEKVRAVGNMKVNARGDVIDDMNRVISSKNDQVNKQYNKQTAPRK